MALGTFAATALQAAPAIIGAINSGDTDVRTPRIQTSFPGLNAGGLRATASANGVNVGSSRGRRSIVSRTSQAFGDQAGVLRGLRGRVAPGVSDLRASRLQAVEDARTRSIGNLRENLQRRRVLGSSFGQDAITRSEAEFAREAERVEAESFLQELDLTQQLLARETEARANSFNTRLNELNLQANLASQLQNRATQVLNQNAQTQARLALEAGRFNATAAQQSAEGFGTLAGNTIGGFFDNRSRLAQIGQNLANSTVVT